MCEWKVSGFPLGILVKYETLDISQIHPPAWIKNAVPSSLTIFNLLDVELATVIDLRN